MCTVSMVSDFYRDKWQSQPYSYIGQGLSGNEISKADFEALRKEVMDLKELVTRALEYDKKNNEPECQMEEKVDLLKRVAKLVGVDLPI